MQRSHYCNLQNHQAPAREGQSLTLNGWIKKIRPHGAICFINLRDRYGEVQLTLDTSQNAKLASQIGQLRLEFCIAVRGELRLRPQDMQNSEIETGKYEVRVCELSILNPCETLPFMPHKGKESDGNEALRMKYRYLDLRSDGMQERMILRHRLKHEIHKFLHERNFLEIETPTLIRSMPEGARDYLVPSRIHSGKFYALPQSPQLYKQLLMVGGLDRYYQIARCYRDEDARGDRQPEFTQLDIEMSFVTGKDVQDTTEELMIQIWEQLLGPQLPQLPKLPKLLRPFPRLSYEAAMNQYGSDKPDLRNPLLLQDFSEFAEKSDFGIFRQALQSGGFVKLLRVPAASEHCSRKVISELEEEAKKYGAKGLAWTRVAKQFDGGIGRFLQDQFVAISEHYALEDGDILFFAADRWDTCCESLGAVRKKLAEDLGLIDQDAFAFAWIVDFPLFLPADDAGWTAAHHMFCMPHSQYLDKLEQDPGAVRGEIYDLVLNGYELGSGSIRIHRADIQERIFHIAGYSPEVAAERFGFLLEALRYGAPPHGGIALGLDRLAMLLAHKESIKEVIAFPKNNLGQSLMDLSPGTVSPKQLEELKITCKEKTASPK